MRRGLLLVIVAACSAAAAFFLLHEGEPGGGEYEGIPQGAKSVGPPPRAEPAEATAALAPGRDASTVPVEIRGSGSIVGRVERDGRPMPAAVALHHVEAFANTDPLGAWRGRTQLDRVLSAGLATGPPIASTRAGATGSFLFAGLAPGAYEIRAVGSAGVSGRAACTIPAAGARVEAIVPLPAGGETLRGRIVHEDGSAFQGWVLVEPGDKPRSYLVPAPQAMVARLDREGRFVMGGLAKGEVQVLAVTPGSLCFVGASFTLPQAEEVLVTVPAGEQTAAGRVLDAANDTPIVGASVSVSSGTLQRGAVLQRVLTDEEGRFTLGVLEGVGGIFVTADGYAPHLSIWDRELVEGQELRLERTATLTGRVVTKAGGDGVSGVWVYALPPASGPSPSLALPAAVRSGRGGAFTLSEVYPGRATVFALGAGWTSPGQGEATPEGYDPFAVTLEAGGTKAVTLEVVKAGQIEGRVETEDGRGVAGAVLTLDSELPFLERLQRVADQGGGVGSAVTDAEGGFRIDTLVPDAEYYLDVQAAGHPAHRSEAIRAAAGEIARVDMTLPSARWLMLTVVSSEGGPVEGAIVEAVKKTGAHAHEGVSGAWITDAEGRARVGPLPAGVLGVRALAVGFAAHRGYDEIAGSTEVELTHTLTLEKGLTCSGRVVVPEGAPVERVSLVVRGSGGSSYFERPIVAKDGTWRQEGIPGQGGSPRVTVFAMLDWKGTHFEATLQTRPGEEDLVLELSESTIGTEIVIVHILDPDGKPVLSGELRVVVHGPGGDATLMQHFSNGRAEVVLDPPPTPERHVVIEVYNVQGGRFGAKSTRPIAPGTKEIEIRLEPGLTIEGRVLDPDGNEVHGVRVRAYPVLPDERAISRERHAEAFTDTEGQFALRGLRKGAYEIRVKPPPGHAPVDPVRTSAGDSDLRISLDRGLAGRVTVYDWQGKPVADAEVQVIGTEGMRSTVYQSAETSTEGVAQLQGLDPRLRYALEVRPPYERKDLRWGEAGAFTGGDVAVHLVRAYLVEGIVRDRSGRGVEFAEVYATQDLASDEWRTAITGGDGSFEFTSLREGEVVIRARFGAMASPRPSEIEESTIVRAGARDVAITVDAGVDLRVRVRSFPGGAGGGEVRAQLMTDDAGRISATSADVNAAGEVVFRGIDSARKYRLWIGPLEGGSYVMARGLRGGGPARELESQVGGTIQGRVEVPDGVVPRQRWVAAEVHGFRVSGELRVDGSFEITGLPEGTWPVGAAVFEEDTLWSGRADAATGTSVSIRLSHEAR